MSRILFFIQVFFIFSAVNLVAQENDSQTDSPPDTRSAQEIERSILIEEDSGEASTRDSGALPAPEIIDFRERESNLVFDGNTGGGAASSVFAVLRTLFVLALTAAAIYGIVYYLKHKKKIDGPDDTFLKVLAKAAITSKTAAAVVSVGDKAYLVGLSDNGVSLISEITEKETVDAMRIAYEEAALKTQDEALDFKALLSKIAGLKKSFKTAKPQNIVQAPDISAELRAKRERLRGL
ncbi:MAG: hypothetical protein Ta2G_14380 [Termitinemataceae bacterium]|nr:MAG: hypothetical protein Ta2G_14380 [Termitinemataceae bacterium]